MLNKLALTLVQCIIRKIFLPFLTSKMRELLTIFNMCTIKGKGCDWQGELNNIAGHLSNNDCRFTRINCSNRCGVSLERQYLSKHIAIDTGYLRGR